MIFTLMCFCFAAAGAHAQTPEPQEDFVVDYDAIREIVTQEGVYDALAARFAAMDSTLTMYDMALLYYGFAFQPGYNGNKDSILSLILKEYNGKGDYQEAWNAGIQFLKDSPVSLTILNELFKAGSSLNLPEDQLEPYIFRLLTLLNIIEYSGDGKSAKTAFKVISVADEYIFMSIALGVSEIKSQALLVGMCDLITITDANNFDGTEIFFDVSLPLEH